MRAAVILSGCGFLDGAEIRESVLALLYLDQQQVDVSIFAPDKAQTDVVDHAAKAPAKESRNVLKEAARIARGEIAPLSQCKAEGFDLLVIPGGFGVAKNLSDLASKGAQATLDKDFARAVQDFYKAKKPIAAICIAPAALALALKNEGVTVTIGDDKGTASAIEASGNRHQNSPTNKAVLDQTHRIASCSAYMRNDKLADIAAGIEQCIQGAVNMARNANQKAA